MEDRLGPLAIYIIGAISGAIVATAIWLLTGGH